MRYLYITPKSGDKRTRTAFLWLPKCISTACTSEYRWLERATWEEVYSEIGGEWYARRWISP